MEEDTSTFSEDEEAKLETSKPPVNKAKLERSTPPADEEATMETNFGTTCHECGASFENSLSLKKHLASHVLSASNLKTSIGKSENDSEKSSIEVKGEALVDEPLEMDDNGHPWPKDGRRGGGRWTGQLLPRDCTQCGKTFPTHNKLKWHVKVVHDKIKNYVCDECEKAFGTNALLNQHKIRVHSTYRPFKCNICYKGHVTKAELVLHMGVHTGEKPWSNRPKEFICGECGKTFGKFRDFEDHRKFHEEGFANKCDQCDKTFNWRSGLQSHIKSCHSTPEEMERYRAARNLSNSRTRKRKTPFSGTRAKKAETELTCHECGNVYDRISTLNRHMATHLMPPRSTVNTTNYVVQTGVGKKVMCAECGKEYANARILKEHVVMIHMGYYQKTQHSGVNADMKADIPEYDKRKMVVPHSETQMQFLKDLMVEFSGKELTSVLDYVKSLKENGDEEFTEGLIKNKVDGCYRSILMDMGVLGMVEDDNKDVPSPSSSGEKIEVEVDVNVKVEADSEDDDEVSFEEELELAEDLAEYADDWSDNEDSKQDLKLDNVAPIAKQIMENGKMKSERKYSAEMSAEDLVQIKGEAIEESPPKKKWKKKDRSMSQDKTCGQCGISVKEHYLRAHMATHLFISLNVMEKIEVSEDGSRIECMECGKEFKQKKNAQEHVVVIHYTEMLNKALKGCTEVTDLVEPNPSSQKAQKTIELFNSLNVLEHIEKSDDGKSGTCLICRKEFSKLNLIKEHVVKKHFGIERKKAIPKPKPMHVCEECGSEFPDSSRLKKHVFTHTGLKPFPCPECGRCFTALGSVKNHVKLIHKGIKDFSCDQCGEKFAKRIYLEDHVQMKHTEEGRARNWFCEYPGCGQAFYKKGHLDRHVIIHSKEKPFQCDQCDKSFAQHGGLVEHIRVHTGEKPFTCHLCGTAFRQTSTLRAHLINVHHEQPEATRGAHLIVRKEASEENQAKGEPVKKMLKKEGTGQNDKPNIGNEHLPKPLMSPPASSGFTDQIKENDQDQDSPNTANPFYPGNDGGSTDALQKLYRGLLSQGMSGMMPPSLSGTLAAPLPIPSLAMPGAMPGTAFHGMNHANEARAVGIGTYRGGEGESSRGYWGQHVKAQYDQQHLNPMRHLLGPQPPGGQVRAGGEGNSIQGLYGSDRGVEERGPWSREPIGQAMRPESHSPYSAPQPESHSPYPALRPESHSPYPAPRQESHSPYPAPRPESHSPYSAPRPDSHSLYPAPPQESHSSYPAQRLESHSPYPAPRPESHNPYAPP